MTQLTLFDYAALDAPLADSLRQRAERIAHRESRIIEDILANGREFAEARDELRHNKAGGFEGWVRHHGWSRRTAYNYIQAWEVFGGNCATVAQLSIDPGALYLLAAPSTPEPARVEALDRARLGEPITHATAQEIVANHVGEREEREAEHEAWKAEIGAAGRTTVADLWEADQQRRDRQAREDRRLAEMRQRAEAAIPGDDRWRIIHADWANGIEEVPHGSVRLAFMDPPYNIGFDYGDGVAADLRPDTTYLDEMECCVREVVDRLTDDGSLWVLICDEYAAEFAAIIKDAGLTIRNWIKWYEPFGVNCTSKFNRTSRHLFYAVKDPSRLVFHVSAVRVPSARQAVYDDPRANPDGKVMDDVWTDIPRLAGTHRERIPTFPTQLPEALLLRIVGCASDPGDLILDPFSGSATTGAAALRLGRRYIGIEKQERFAHLSTLRLKGEGNGCSAGN